MSQNSCKSYGSCRKEERTQLKYPIDQQSLYASRIYDNQTGNRRCYEKNPIEIIEGFGCGLFFEKLLKYTVVILLILALFFLAKDVIMPKQQVSISAQLGGMLDVTTAAEIMTAIPL